MKRTALTPNLPVIREVVGAPTIGLQPGSKVYKMGKVSIIVSPPYEGLGWHLSIAHPEHYPTWDEIAEARYKLIPDDHEMVMCLPPKADYVNIHDYCFHLHEIPRGILPR